MRSTTAVLLIVDDEVNDQQILAHAFRRLKISNPIRCVDSGNEAIDYLNGSGEYADRKAFPYPSYILTDLKMPNGDGFTLLENLKSNPEWAVIPTIVISGSADADDIKKSYILGASAFLVKPDTLEGFERLAKNTFEFWNMVQTPEVDESGQQLPTKGEGKLGARFPSPHYVKRPRLKRN